MYPPEPGRVLLQSRRHARAHDKRRVPLDAASRRNASAYGRLSFPFFFDPSWDAQAPNHDGTYGEYLVAKVSKVFPELQRDVL